GAAALSLSEAPRACERVEPEPGVHARWRERNECIEGERRRSRDRDADGSFVRARTIRVRRDHMPRSFVGDERMENRCHERALRDEIVAQRLRRTVHEESVRRNHERPWAQHLATAKLYDSNGRNGGNRSSASSSACWTRGARSSCGT